MAHRKEEKAAEKQLKVELETIENDRSPSKRSSYVRLLDLISQMKEKGVMRLYTKK